MIANQDTEFEIPSEVRVVAERSVQLAKLAFNNYMMATESVSYSLDERFNAGQVDAEDIGRNAVSFALRNTISTFEFAQKIVQARDIAEFSYLLTEFLQSQLRLESEPATGRGDICSNRFLLRTNP